MRREVLVRFAAPLAFTLATSVFAVCAVLQLPVDAAGFPVEEGPWALPSMIAAVCCGCVGPVWLALSACSWWIGRARRVAPAQS